MGAVLQDFTERQHMVSGDFEYFHYRDEPHPQVHYHSHDFYEIYFFISGKASYIIEGKTYKLRSGDILLVNNSEFHMPVIERGQPYERIVVWLKPDFLQLKSRNGTNLKLCFEGAAGRRLNLLRMDDERLSIIRGVLLRLGKAIAASGFGSDILREACVLELLVYLNRVCLDSRLEHNDIEDMEYNEKVSSMIDYINDNLESDLSLNELSGRFYTSRYHLLRVFKKYAGCTLHHYIRRKRLIIAKDLLRKGHTVSEACTITGFGDYSNFIRSFRNEFGISPGKYNNTDTLQSQALL
jgi:AraC-like DNA-binding protein/mannose-6-phosphate isomerase-like protein (cupin superfamily)